MPDSSRWRRIATGRAFLLASDSPLFGMSAQPPSLSPLLSREIAPMMPEDLKELLRVFNDHKVEYLIVGGYAYGVHAEPRATKDQDDSLKRRRLTAVPEILRENHDAHPLDGCPIIPSRPWPPCSPRKCSCILNASHETLRPLRCPVLLNRCFGCLFSRCGTHLDL